MQFPFRKKRNKGSIRGLFKLFRDPLVRSGFRHLLREMVKIWKLLTANTVFLVIAVAVNLLVPVLQVQMDEDNGQPLWFVAYALLLAIAPAMEMLQLQLRITIMRVLEFGLHQRTSQHLRHVRQSEFEDELPGEIYQMRQVLLDLASKAEDALGLCLSQAILGFIYLAFTISTGLHHLPWWILLGCFALLFGGVKGLSTSADFFDQRLKAMREYARRHFLRVGETRDRLREETDDEQQFGTRLDAELDKSLTELDFVNKLYMKGITSKVLSTHVWRICAMILAIFFTLNEVVGSLSVLEALVLVTYVKLTIESFAKALTNASTMLELTEPVRTLHRYMNVQQMPQGSLDPGDRPITGYAFTGVQKTYTSTDRGNKSTEKSIYKTPIEFEVNEPGLTVVVGESGGGKSTLLQMSSRRNSPTKGAVVLKTSNGMFPIEELTDSAFARRVYSIDQAHVGGIYRECSVGENLASVIGGPFHLDEHGRFQTPQPEWSKIQRKAMELALQRVGLSLNKFPLHRVLTPSNISGGENQRICAARLPYKLLMQYRSGDQLPVKWLSDGTWQFSDAVSGNFLVADEPNGPLDDKNTQLTFELLLDLARNNYVLAVIHHKLELLPHNTRVIFLDAQGQMHKTTIREYLNSHL